MLTELRIRNLGVIAEAVLEPGPGLTVVTGETGAGKTMVVTGLSLLLGGRADGALVRHGAFRCLVEGRWTVDEQASAGLDELGAEIEDGELLVSRQVGPSRSRALVGGAAVPMGQLAALLSERATIHGQAEQVRLGGTDRQRDLLDRYAGDAHLALVARHAELFTQRRRFAEELTALVGAARERARELDLLRFGLAEVAAADPQPGEDATLAGEAGRLQAVDELRLVAHTAAVALSGDPDAWDDAPSARSLLAVAAKALDAGAGSDPELAPLRDRVAEASALVADVASELASYADRLEADPARLEWIGARRAALQQLLRKYGATLAEVLAWAAEAEERVAALEASDGRIGELERRVAEFDGELAQTAAAITAARTAAALELAERVGAELAALAMPHASISFELGPGPLGAHGADQITLMFAANPGSAPLPLAKAASGGELSRVRLALEVVLAAGAAGHTFVFDEVDAGVGGAVALEIGRRLARLAEQAQVIVVTHLAQVAAFAADHFVVAKASDGRITSSGISRVTGAARLDELARMMAGLDGSANAHGHAAELLAAASE